MLNIILGRMSLEMTKKTEGLVGEVISIIPLSILTSKAKTKQTRCLKFNRINRRKSDENNQIRL